MIRHHLLINWKKETTPEQIAAAIEKTRGMRALPFIRALHCGEKLGLVADSSDFALTIDFADSDGWHAYQADPTHAAHAAFVRPLCASWTRCQIEIDD